MGNIITTILEKLKINNPSRNEKAGYFLMHDAETKEVCAVPEAAILAKVNSRIDGIIYPDGFTKTTEINRVGNTVTIAPLDFEWRIQLNPYANADEYTKTFDATESSELKRIDTLAATTEGTIVYYKGEEDEFFVKPPRIPTTQLRLSDFSIFGDDVQEHTEPIVSEVYTLAEKNKLAILDPTADIDKPVSTAQAAADAATLASANSYTDSKVTSVYKWKGSVANSAALPSSGNTIGDVWDLLDTGMNYGWTGSGWDALGTTVNISGKEDSSNKVTTMTGNESSNVFFLTAKAIYDWAVSFFQAKDNQIEVSTSGNVQNSWHGQTILFTANCTITVPAALNNELMFPFRTLAGVTVTWAITSPFTWETTPSTTPEKTTGHFMRRGATNTILLDV